MMRPLRASLTTIALLAIVRTAAAQELTPATYVRWRDYLRPGEKDLAYKSIPWRAGYWDAVVEAQAKDKPILLWAMNGHPLGCT
jgi:hypothetical protein